MARLGDVLGAIIGQIGHGRAQADLTAVDVAQLYKDHPLLAEFPVPRLELSEVIVDLRTAINGVTTSTKAFSPESKASLVQQLTTYVAEVPASARMQPAVDRYPAFTEQWNSTSDILVAGLAEQVPVTIDVDARMLSALMAALLQQHVDTAVRAASTTAGDEADAGTNPAAKAGAVDTFELLKEEIGPRIGAILQADPDLRALSPQGRTMLLAGIRKYLDGARGYTWAKPIFSTAASVALWDARRDDLSEAMGCAVAVFTPIDPATLGKRLAEILADHITRILDDAGTGSSAAAAGRELSTALRPEIERTIASYLADGGKVDDAGAQEIVDKLKNVLDGVEQQFAVAHYFKEIGSLHDLWNERRESELRDDMVSFIATHADNTTSVLAAGVADLISGSLVSLIRDQKGDAGGFTLPKDVADTFAKQVDTALRQYPAAIGIAPDQRQAVLADLQAYTDGLPGSNAAAALGLADPAVAAIWTRRSAAVNAAVDPLLPTDLVGDLDKLTGAVASAIDGNIAVAKAQAAAAQAITIPNVQDEAQGQLQSMITDALAAGSPVTTGIDVLVTTDELREVAPESITNMKLTLREADMSWSRSVDSKGVVQSQLVS